jgi:glycosyltransferase involved in cell wall biosynthesis
VVFLGPQFNQGKVACYHNCDAFILPSFSEGLPMVILEAWAYRKPVLMTSQCNLPEGFTASAAIQIEPEVGSITAGLDFLFHAAGDQIHTLGKNGHSLVATRFNWPRCAQEMLQVYHWLLGSGPKPACVI